MLSRLFWSLVILLVPLSVSAYAAGLDLSGVSVDTTPVFSLALIVITAIAGIWAIKKVIRLGNRS